MFDIAAYLQKFKKFSQSRDFLRNAVAEAIREICTISVDPKNITVKDGIARVSERPIIKNEIFLKKKKILEIVKQKTDNKVLDIL